MLYSVTSDFCFRFCLTHSLILLDTFIPLGLAILCE